MKSQHALSTNDNIVNTWVHILLAIEALRKDCKIKPTGEISNEEVRNPQYFEST
jgi:hypothetical protein